MSKPTPLNSWHLTQKGRMAPFAGWSMPIQYTSIVEEHLAVRRGVGVTDVSHMGRFVFRGSGAGEFLGSVVTRRIADMKFGLVRYSLLTNQRGGIIDDLVVGHFNDTHGEELFYVVVNASNSARDAEIFSAALPPHISMTDVTDQTAMLAVQGPESPRLVAEVVDPSAAEFRYYHGGFFSDVAGVHGEMLVKRTGYTGSDGFEIVLPAADAVAFVERLFATGHKLGIEPLLPVGLAARDSLRIEAAMPLYGHEITEEINPFEAGLEKAVFLTGLDFPGRDALVKLSAEPLSRVRVGIVLDAQRPARHECKIVAGGNEIGVVTSGTFSPILQRPIAMGYVPPSLAAVGTRIEIDIRGQLATATVAATPFLGK
ncbi:MAG: glycine cleavage system aminomethyltransferase GcvT [Thermoguttaceae bacterium]